MKRLWTIGLWGTLGLCAAMACSSGESTSDDPADCQGSACSATGGGGMGGSGEPGKDLCKGDDECDDGAFCNGTEKCDPDASKANSKGCVLADDGACPGQACDEAADECLSCDLGDVDQDGHKAIDCDGDDCDDNDKKRYPGNQEVCDAEGHDEDCDFETLGAESDAGVPDADKADKDDDLFADVACCNTQENGDLVCGDDCDDSLKGVNKGAVEACNGIDDNCDDIVDGEESEGDLKETFFEDKDGDGAGAEESETLSCMQPGPSWVDNGGDCEDDTSSESEAQSIHPGADEKCNGKDDDCDGKVDALDDDSALVGKPSISGTSYECTDGKWAITSCPAGKVYCDEDPANGCETDATTLQNCHGCNTNCSFSCGAAACDEIALFGGGSYHTCAATSGGLAYCWGRNDAGQLGDNSKTQRPSPTLVSGLTGVTALSGGLSHTCAVASGAVYCWGTGARGHLGLGATIEKLTPGKVSNFAAATSVGAGEQHTCAVVGGAVWCWGQQANGRLGNGSSGTSTKSTPTQAGFSAVSGFVDATQVVAGVAHTCVRSSGGTVACFGDDSSGQLGTPGAASSQAYAQTLSLSSVSMLAAGDYHTCALSSGTVYCWGDNSSKQLGTNDAGPVASPVAVPGLTGVTQIAAGATSTCALASGVLKCWGSNDLGEVGAPATGVGSATQTTVPLSSVASVLAQGSQRTCALLSNKKAYCFGNDSNGQLGDGGTTSTHVPALLSLE